MFIKVLYILYLKHYQNCEIILFIKECPNQSHKLASILIAWKNHNFFFKAILFP